MLLAVEGGGFFLSSASGYSKGLMILLPGRSKDERYMRIAPWNHYRLAEQEGKLEHQLATRKSESPGGCVPFTCFHCASPGVDGPSPPKVGPGNHSETLPDSPSSSSSASDRGNACSAKHHVVNTDMNLCIKSSLKKPATVCSTPGIVGDLVHDSMVGEEHSAVGCADRRKVRWTDSCGRELVQIKEFEPSDDETSDDDFERDLNQRCQCAIQ